MLPGGGDPVGDLQSDFVMLVHLLPSPLPPLLCV